MTPRLAFILAASAILGGCSTFPQLDAAISDEALSADYPTLVPTEELRVAAATGPIVPREPVTAPQIDTRAASLKARAASLRGDVIDAASKERLEQEIKIDEEDV